jgi:hypothetical protein
MLGFPNTGRSMRAVDMSSALQTVFAKAERARQEAAWNRKLKRAEEARIEAMRMLQQDDVPDSGMSPDELKAAVEAHIKGSDGSYADSKELDEATQEKRRELAAARKKKKGEDAARLKAENKAMKDKIKNTKTKTDDDTNDDATGVARARAEKERKARLKAEQDVLSKDNKMKRDRIKNTKAATDDDITDDVGEDGTVGAGRGEAAATSKARKAAEAARSAAAAPFLEHRQGGLSYCRIARAISATLAAVIQP